MTTSSRDWVAQVSGAGLLPGAVRRGVDDLVRSFAGKKVRIKISLYRKQRSGNQNRYYWKVVVSKLVEMFREAGNNVDAEDVHEFLKLRIGKLAQVFVTPDGEVMKGLGSTTKLTTLEFENYVAKIRAFAAEYGCIIPEPNEEVNQLTEEEDNDEARA